MRVAGDVGARYNDKVKEAGPGHGWGLHTATSSLACWRRSWATSRPANRRSSCSRCCRTRSASGGSGSRPQPPSA
eukprot:205247-Lingulodinium_polyedra.AAC.1